MRVARKIGIGNMKKNILCMVCAMAVMIGFWGCGAPRSQKKDDRLKVVATVFAEYDFLRHIGGDAINLSMLMLPGADVHTFDPTPKDMKTVQDADLFVTVGGESDAWADTIVESVDNEHLECVRLMDLVDEVVEEEIVEGMEVEEHDEEAHQEEADGHGDEEGAQEENAGSHGDEKEFDEHVWTSPKNAMQIVEGLCGKLSQLDQKNAGLYQKNAEQYQKKLEVLDQKFTQVVSNSKRREIVVADRFPFRYFADAYGLKYYAAYPGCSTQTGASVETIAFLIDKVKEDKIPVVFHMELSSQLMCNTICDETGAKKAQLNAVHNISKRNFDRGIGYLELMEKNVDVLREALQGQ